MRVGYARVSTLEQSLDLQLDALNRWGCERVFCDKSSGSNYDRPQLNEALEFLRQDDVLVVWKLDRFGRSLVQTIESIV